MQYHPQEISGSKNGFPSELLYMRMKKNGDRRETGRSVSSSLSASKSQQNYT